MLYLTMNQIKSHSPCTSGWSNLLKKAKENGLSYPEDGDTPISMNTLLDWCPTQDIIWAFRCNWAEGKELYVKFAKNCAKRAERYAANAAHAHAAAHAAANAANANAYAHAAAHAHAAAYTAAKAAANASANAAYAAYTAANAANAAYERERSRQKASLKALIRDHKG